MEMTNNAPLYWYVFYNDQLLLQKKAGGGYTIPFMDKSPVETYGRASLPQMVEMQDGTVAMAVSTDEPLEETDVYLPMGLRASYDHIDRYFYDQAGKALRDTLLGPAQPLLSGLRDADGTEGADREEVSRLRI